jgi:hypothetical protein
MFVVLFCTHALATSPTYSDCVWWENLENKLKITKKYYLQYLHQNHNTNLKTQPKLNTYRNRQFWFVKQIPEFLLWNDFIIEIIVKTRLVFYPYLFISLPYIILYLILIVGSCVKLSDWSSNNTREFGVHWNIWI